MSSEYPQTFFFGGVDEPVTAVAVETCVPLPEALQRGRGEVEADARQFVLRFKERRHYRADDCDPDLVDYGTLSRCEPTDDGAFEVWVMSVIWMRLVEELPQSYLPRWKPRVADPHEDFGKFTPGPAIGFRPGINGELGGAGGPS